MKKKIYIAGKVSGLDRTECLAKFAAAQKKIEDLGFEAVNPMEIVPDGTEWHKAMKLCIKALMDCDAIILLHDWKNSKGAFMEWQLANHLEIPIFNATKFGFSVMKINSEEWNS